MARKNRRYNELKIPLEHLNIEGRQIKHQAFIDHFANININKLSDKPINLIGLDIETEPDTGEMKLLGFYENADVETYKGVYSSYTANFLAVLFQKLKWAYKHEYSFAHWNKLDPYQILKLFLLPQKDIDKVKLALMNYSKIGGEWNKNTKEWDIEPLVKLENEMYEFGILNAVRGAICLFYRAKDNKTLRTVWSYDIGGLLQGTIEKEGDGSYYIDEKDGKRKKKAGRFEWYHKGDDEVHLVDWKRYFTDNEYKQRVLASNERDARCAMGLGYEVQKDIHRAYGHFPTSLISQGAIARFCVVAIKYNNLKAKGYTKEQIQEELYDKVSDIGIMKHYDYIADNYGGDFLKDLLALASESYSGGEIEGVMNGYTESGWIADISSAYPSYIQDLYNLRGAKYSSGKGNPPKAKETDYIFIRGKVTIPEELHFHPITIKNPLNTQANVRPTGTFIASYTHYARDFVLEHGGSFEDESWILIETKGELSTLAEMVRENVKLRDYFKSINSSSQYTAKTVNASAYGITFECVNTYIPSEKSGEPERIGYRAGEFYNPVYASVITERTRVLLSKASMAIKNKGGDVILLMTDSVTWKGRSTDIPKELVRKEKVLGYFEEPEEIKDIVCFGSGRYSYTKVVDGFREIKRRGLNVVGYEGNYDIELAKRFDWLEILKIIKETGSLRVKLKVRFLVSPSIIPHSKEFVLEDLGRIVERVTEVEVIAGKDKRIMHKDTYDIEKLTTGLCSTKPYYFDKGMFEPDKYVDGTLPKIRALMNQFEVKTNKERLREHSRNTTERYQKTDKYKKKMPKYYKEYNDKYGKLKKMGLNRDFCKKFSGWKWEKIIKEFDKRGWEFKHDIANIQ